ILAGAVRPVGHDARRRRTQGQDKETNDSSYTRPVVNACEGWGAVKVTGEVTMTDHQVVSREAWIEARRALLAKEKEFTRLRGQLSQTRRARPGVRVEKPYAFEGSQGTETLPQLFDGRSQLVVYHFMFGPDSDTPCKSCSFWADNLERNVVHLNARDVTVVVVSRAPLAKLDAFRQRMGWTFKWVSSGKSDFNFDYNVSFRPHGAANPRATSNYVPKTWGGTELPGISVFF